mmetsp:Transcript_23707/g.49225  ORF Transcript_23707/g.49225 Transcript_23707/m.49225 type:complete len:313 (-) Transcript_23707:51-989(-)
MKNTQIFPAWPTVSRKCLVLLDLGALSLEWANGQGATKDGATGINDVNNTGRNGRQTGRRPVDKVMHKVRWHGHVSTAPDGPSGGQHGIDSRSSCGEELNQGSHSSGCQSLFDQVMIGSKIDFPIDQVHYPQEQKGGTKFRKKGLTRMIFVFGIEFRSAKGGHLQSIRDGVEQGKGHQSTCHLSRYAHIRFRVTALAQGPHAHGDGGVDVLTAAKIIGRHDTGGVRQPRDIHVVLSNPFARTKGANDHEQGANELVAPFCKVFAAFNKGGANGGGHARWNVTHQILEKDFRCFDVVFHHGFFCGCCKDSREQ